ncbi:unnamed protein product [Paramecium primaurelia]|uniref:Uncharacterized protein n=2 Tax=Paramecium TaxID=5884 RepID=A0A8S1YFK2_9CILI|nr:unnamed protein product [Paramecium primaurelia]CAD8212670.1 unnamed protein product [Paramecium pentaurelia]
MIKLKICETQKTKSIFKFTQALSDPNIPIEEVQNQGPQTHSNKELEMDIDQLSYQKLFSSNEIDQEIDFYDSRKSNSQMGVSPGLSITSYDLEQTDKALEIQPYGSVSYNQREVPQIVLALRKRRPAQIQIVQTISQSQESCKTLSNFSLSDLSPMQTKRLQVKSVIEFSLFENDEEEIYSVFEDELNHYGTLPQSKIDFLDNLHKFLVLYKMRAGTFPRQRENLENEMIISIAMNLAKVDKQLFKQYFPSKKVFFDDENDYTRIKKVKRKQIRQLTLVETPDFQYVKDDI